MAGSTGGYFVSVADVALSAATIKTVFELGTSSAVRAKITEWWVEFDGTTPTNTPVLVEVGRYSAGVTTATSFTPSKYYTGDGASASTCKYNTTSEGAGTAVATFEHRVNPTGGIYIQYPLDREPIVQVSGFFRIRCTAAQAVNATFGVSWEE